MSQETVACPQERRADKEQKEIGTHCTVECRGFTGSWTPPKGVAEGLEGLGEFWRVLRAGKRQP